VRNLAITPNPLRGAGRIHFELAQGAAVRVTLVDLQGRERARLADGHHPAGPMEVAFETGDLESGLYWCLVQAAGRSEKRAVVIIK
jgi:hypothetical protein